MRIKFFCSVFLLVLILFGFENAKACECMGREKPTTEFRKTPVIFVGTVKSVNSVDSRKFGYEYNRYDLQTTFSVNEAFKGVKGNEIDIFSSSQGTACGIEFQKGEQYLVYAYDDGEKKRFYNTDICTRTRFTENKEDEIAVLRSLAKGNFKPRIYGRVEEIVRGILLEYKENVPMSNIKVIAKNGSNIYESITDKDGRFRFVNIKTGSYKLEVKLPTTHKVGDDSWGWTEKQKVNLNYSVTNRDCPDFINIATRVDGRIKGKVSDFQGNPVGKGVRVTLITKEIVNNPDNNIQYIGTDTDNRGFYEFEGIPKGEYFLGINLDLTQPDKNNPYSKNFYPNSTDSKNAALINLGYGQKLSGFDITLPPPLKQIIVKGKVIKKDGSPVAGITVYVSNQARHDFEDFVWLKTDKNGEFTATCLEGVTYRFSIYEKDLKKISEIMQKINEQSNNRLEFVIGN
ncbi:MAG: hypothetical protein K1X72_20365 [Pyrinomonadaceae bacterium]|nr:hypothetical protein [Pyrinomonadaceae bacterium]